MRASAGASLGLTHLSSGSRVLVVDDDADSALMVATLLEFEGHETRQAHDGVEGFEVARDFDPRIAVVDLDMPRRNGLELARLIRAQSWGAGIFLIALTGHSDPDTRVRASVHGFDVFMSKPMDPASFEAVIRKASSSDSKRLT